uniref:Uncharacterized protein n=1 Tax=Schistocephalus solidus TaxID=70667 RepID=A0A0V0JAS6_SCHSO
MVLTMEFVPRSQLPDLNYASLASSFHDLQFAMSSMSENATAVGLSINSEKTKLFSSRIPGQDKEVLGINGCQLEEVDGSIYLSEELLPNKQIRRHFLALLFRFSQSSESGYGSDATSQSPRRLVCIVHLSGQSSSTVVNAGL